MSRVEDRTPAGVRLVLLLAAAEGRSSEEMTGLATREARAIRDELLTAGCVVRVSLGKRNRVVGASETGVDRSDFEAVIDVSGPEGDATDLISAAKGLARRSDGVVDADHSVAVAGREYIVRPGGGLVQIHFCLRRQPSLSLEEFRDLWRGGFAAEARKVNHVSGYRQVEVDPQWARAASEETGLAVCDVDGVAVEWFADDDAFRRAVEETTADSGIVKEGQKLMDMNRSLSLLSETGRPV